MGAGRRDEKHRLDFGLDGILLDEVQRALQVDFDVATGILHARVAHDDVCRNGQLRERVLVRDVGNMVLVFGVVNRRFLDVEPDHMRAPAQEQFRDGAADAAVRSADKDVHACPALNLR